MDNNIEFIIDTTIPKPLIELTNNELLDRYERAVESYCSYHPVTQLDRDLSIIPIRLELRRRIGGKYE